MERWQNDQPKLAIWAEENLPEGFAVFDLPDAHRRKMRTSNSCQNLNSQIKRRTRVAGIFPSEDSLQRLVTGVLIEISENWESGRVYLKNEQVYPKKQKPDHPSAKGSERFYRKKFAPPFHRRLFPLNLHEFTTDS